MERRDEQERLSSKIIACVRNFLYSKELNTVVDNIAKELVQMENLRRDSISVFKEVDKMFLKLLHYVDEFDKNEFFEFDDTSDLINSSIFEFAKMINDELTTSILEESDFQTPVDFTEKIIIVALKDQSFITGRIFSAKSYITAVLSADRLERFFVFEKITRFEQQRMEAERILSLDWDNELDQSVATNVQNYIDFCDVKTRELEGNVVENEQVPPAQHV